MTAWVFDTECTGKEDDREIIEAAWIEIPPEQDMVGESDRLAIDVGMSLCTPVICQRFKPERPITFGAMAVHHILPDELAACPPSSSFRIPGHVKYLVGHSIDFDWVAAGSPDHVKRICTYALAQHTWPDQDSYSQSALLYALLGATAETRALLQGAHSADIDVTNNVLLLAKILACHPAIQTWRALWEYSEVCRIPITCPLGKWKGTPLDEVADMDPGYCDWLLRQHWLDPYLRIGVERALGQERLL